MTLRVTVGAALCAAAVTVGGCGASTSGAGSGPQRGHVAIPSSVGPTGAIPVAVAPSATAAPAPRPRPNACAHNSAAQLITVRLAVQHLWMCQRHRLVYSSAITSGMVGQWTSTPTGRYAIQAFQRNTTLTLLGGATYAVKYWIPFDGPLFGFHDSSWQDFPYGSATYRTRGSHGCIHLPLQTIAFLYRWARVGATVTIRA